MQAQVRQGAAAVTAAGALAVAAVAGGCAAKIHVRAINAALVNGAAGWSKSTLVVHSCPVPANFSVMRPALSVAWMAWMHPSH